ncbi:hypothetical protein VT84_05650 [Gemmata sp. SH-PL17]|uniref:DUF4058 family protein n=1 Tax=Gemmata sp. SH-PL17 TaxID=1630693 RepID=UPI0004AE872E|nr:DUF4058 family protein [Gemmata sp. SH-PL17]AMV23877.1 hypothetical protein VT84_05650 [Gemmata sp. SH-PL17]
MPSPFPGMNPYIERPDVWNDFHDSFIPAVREVLTAQVQPRYYVRIEEHLYIHEPAAKERFALGRPDLSVHPNPHSVVATSGTAISAPAYVGMPVIVEEERLPYLEIRDRVKNEVVTIIELLSPANKATGGGREHYLAKVQRILASKTNFVEIDLLRGHAKMPWDRLPECDYYALVSRHADRQGDDPRAAIWPWKVRDPLPTIPIPLRTGEAEPTVDLQAILHRVYDAAGYSMFLYDSDPEPSLSASDAVWAAQLLHPQPPSS